MAFAGAGNITATTALQRFHGNLLPRHRIFAVHSADPAKKPSQSVDMKSESLNWAPESWKSRKALQIPVYPNKEELDSVLQTLESFPPLIFAGEARKLEERLADAAVGKAFLLQGGDCAESFKEFNANNIRDTFRVLLQMGVVLTFGGQMPIIKVRFCCVYSIVIAGRLILRHI